MNESFDVLRDEHNTRMKNVMADFRALSDSMVVSAVTFCNVGRAQYQLH